MDLERCASSAWVLPEPPYLQEIKKYLVESDIGRVMERDGFMLETLRVCPEGASWFRVKADNKDPLIGRRELYRYEGSGIPPVKDVATGIFRALEKIMAAPIEEGHPVLSEREAAIDEAFADYADDSSGDMEGAPEWGLDRISGELKYALWPEDDMPEHIQVRGGMPPNPRVLEKANNCEASILGAGDEMRFDPIHLENLRAIIENMGTMSIWIIVSGCRGRDAFVEIYTKK